MKKTSGRKVSKSVAKLSKKANAAPKKIAKRAKKKANNLEVKSKSLLKQAQKKLTDIKNRSSKSLHHAKDKVYATEAEIMAYVKKNPIKSVSAVALTALIGEFVATRFKK